VTLTISEILFWLGAGAALYSYALYPVLLFLLAAVAQTARDLFFLLLRRNRRGGPRGDALPSLSLLIAAYNEESVIEQKLRNTAQLDYPAEKLEVLLGLDAPSDGTAQGAARVSVPGMRVLHFPERRGKLAVLNDLVAASRNDIVVSTDANTILEPGALRALARHFADPAVGLVSTEVDVTDPSGRLQNESLYWRYEVMLKFLENRLNCVVGNTGALYAVRREWFPRVSSVVEDFEIAMRVRYAGHRVVYDPESLAREDAAPSLEDEFRRKVRIGAGCFQTLFACPQFLNPLAGLPAFAYFSHKVLRWLGPLFLLTAWVASLLLVARPFYAAAFAAQTAFYALALLGWQIQRSGKTPGALAIPLYFTSMNLALLLGLFRWLSGQQKPVWSSTPRELPPTAASAARGEPK